MPTSEIARYQVLKTLGRGGMGVVYLARDERLGRVVALKVLDLSHQDDETLARFAQEAQVMAEVRHEALVPLLDARIEHTPPYLALAYMEGGSLTARLDPAKRPDGRTIAEAGERLAGALHALHQAGALHRDVKCANVLLDARGAVHLSDLGLARSTSSNRMTRTGTLVGTPGYLAPELMAGGDYSPRSDLFALGVTLLEMAVGRRFAFQPLPGPPTQELEAVEPANLRALIARCLATRPERRPGSCREAAEEFASVVPRGTRTGMRSLEAKAPTGDEETAEYSLLEKSGSGLLETSGPLSGPGRAPSPVSGPLVRSAGFRIPSSLVPTPARRARQGREWGLALVEALLLMAAALGVRGILALRSGSGAIEAAPARHGASGTHAGRQGPDDPTFRFMEGPVPGRPGWSRLATSSGAGSPDLEVLRTPHQAIVLEAVAGEGKAPRWTLTLPTPEGGSISLVRSGKDEEADGLRFRIEGGPQRRTCEARLVWAAPGSWAERPPEVTGCLEPERP